MLFTKNILSLSALLSLAAAYPTKNNTAIAPQTPQNTTILDLDVELAALELEIELDIAINNGVLEIDLEIEIGDLEVELEVDIPLPTIPAPKDLAFLHRTAPPHRTVHDKNVTALPDHRFIHSRMMEEITCSLPHTHLSPTAGEVFRSHFASLNNGTYGIPAYKHIVWKIGKDRFRVENHTGKDVTGLKYADNEFAAQQFGLVCPENCKGKACWGKDGVWDEKIWNRIYTV